MFLLFPKSGGWLLIIPVNLIITTPTSACIKPADMSIKHTKHLLLVFWQYPASFYATLLLKSLLTWFGLLSLCMHYRYPCLALSPAHSIKTKRTGIYKALWQLLSVSHVQSILLLPSLRRTQMIKGCMFTRDEIEVFFMIRQHDAAVDQPFLQQLTQLEARPSLNHFSLKKRKTGIFKPLCRLWGGVCSIYRMVTTHSSNKSLP